MGARGGFGGLRPGLQDATTHTHARFTFERRNQAGPGRRTAARLSRSDCPRSTKRSHCLYQAGSQVCPRRRRAEYPKRWLFPQSPGQFYDIDREEADDAGSHGSRDRQVDPERVVEAAFCVLA